MKESFPLLFVSSYFLSEMIGQYFSLRANGLREYFHDDVADGSHFYTNEKFDTVKLFMQAAVGNPRKQPHGNYYQGINKILEKRTAIAI